MKILIIEDEAQLLGAMHGQLDRSGLVCETAATLKAARDKLAAYAYDIVILDINLPDGSGLSLLDQIKGDHPRMGILIVSARNALDDKLKGLDLGADDYLTKPFHLAELNSRVNAIIRRRNFNGSSVVTFHEITIDHTARSARVHDKLLDLTRKEYDLLLYLIVNRDRVLTREAIAEHLWGDAIDLVDNFDFIYTHMKNLRRKIAAAGGADHVRTVYGIGYRFTGS